MKIVLASDHGGYLLKQYLIDKLKEQNIFLVDLGADSPDKSVDYPDFALSLGKFLNENHDFLGILICGTGIGMSIAANKIKGIRAALVHNEYTAEMAKKHNNANVLVLGGRILDLEYAFKLVKIWLDANFEADRHLKRIFKISSFEE